MGEVRKIKHSFCSYFEPMTNETFVELDELAELLAKGWGDLPKSINNTRAMELHLLGKAFINLQKRMSSFENNVAKIYLDTLESKGEK